MDEQIESVIVAEFLFKSILLSVEGCIYINVLEEYECRFYIFVWFLYKSSKNIKMQNEDNLQIFFRHGHTKMHTHTHTHTHTYTNMSTSFS